MTEPPTFSLTDSVNIPRDSFWVRIADQLADGIRSGLYPPGQRLPSEHALAHQFGVNRHTIRRSLASLTSHGLVRVSQGSGTFVEDFAVDLMLGKRPRHKQNLASAGIRGELRVLDASTARATDLQIQTLRLPSSSGSRVLRLRVLGVAEETPLHVSERCFPLPRFADMEAVLRREGSITAGFLAHGVVDYTRLESRITAEMPDSATATALQQSINRPVLRVDSVNVDPAGVPIEMARACFAGDRVKLTVASDV
jgi:GntR family transcriptional regulator, phosphonate transport system regulatory protein